jgi:hypothetical protein
VLLGALASGVLGLASLVPASKLVVAAGASSSDCAHAKRASKLSPTNAVAPHMIAPDRRIHRPARTTLGPALFVAPFSIVPARSAIASVAGESCDGRTEKPKYHVDIFCPDESWAPRVYTPAP